MPDGRFVSKSISVSEQLWNFSLEADLLFGRCIPHLDVDGRITGNPKGLKAIVCPLRDELSHQKITHLLRELGEADLVVWYEVNGAKFLEFPTFARHQRGMKRDREAVSRIPSSKVKAAQRLAEKLPEPAEELRTSSGLTPDFIPPSEVKESEVKSRVVKVTDSDESESKVSKLTALPKVSCDRLHSTWNQKFGAMDYARFRKAILPIFEVPADQRPSLDEADAAIVAAWEWWIEQDDRDQGFFNLAKFVEQFGKWRKFGAMPLIDPIRREPTERGNWAGSKALRQKSRRAVG
jgi:hypothetical protein